ncbi:MAG: VWA domain-containing protein [Parachlamydiaceae bacterium]|nr:VWA domain-containing protein [Parachlamydiaceae bacterium]
MSGIFFEIDWIALLLALAFCFCLYFLWHWQQRFAKPALFFSDVSAIKNQNSVRVKLGNLPNKLLWLSLILFTIAFIDPHFLKSRAGTWGDHPTEGIAIYLVVDQSGSMAEKVPVYSKGRFETLTKMDLVKEMTTQFVKGSEELSGRPNDLIGLVSFARSAQVLVPLSLDHQAIMRALSQLEVVKNKEQDGTAMGYALLKAVNLIAATRHYAQDLVGIDQPSYAIQSNIVILVTDGFPAPSILDQNNPLRNVDLLTVADYAKKNDVKVYLVTVDPKLNTEEFVPHRNLMKRVAEITGGQYYLINDKTSLNTIYTDIDQLEKSTLPVSFSSKDLQPHRYQRISLYPYFIAAGLLVLLASALLNATLLRRIP